MLEGLIGDAAKTEFINPKLIDDVGKWEDSIQKLWNKKTKELETKDFGKIEIII